MLCFIFVPIIDYSQYFFKKTSRYPFATYHRTTQLLAVGRRDSHITIYDLKQGQKIHDLNTKETPTTKTSSFSFSQLSSSVFYSSSGGSGGGEGGKGGGGKGGGEGGEIDLDAPLEGVIGVSFNEAGKVMAAFNYQEGTVSIGGEERKRIFFVSHPLSSQISFWQLYSMSPLSIFGITFQPKFLKVFPVPKTPWTCFSDFRMVCGVVGVFFVLFCFCFFAFFSLFFTGLDCGTDGGIASRKSCFNFHRLI